MDKGELDELTSLYLKAPKARQELFDKYLKEDKEKAIRLLKGYEIEVPVWWSNGDGLSQRRSALHWAHPQSEYSYIKYTLELDPENFGHYNNYVHDDEEDNY